MSSVISTIVWASEAAMFFVLLCTWLRNAESTVRCSTRHKYPIDNARENVFSDGTQNYSTFLEFLVYLEFFRQMDMYLQLHNICDNNSLLEIWMLFLLYFSSLLLFYNLSIREIAGQISIKFFSKIWGVNWTYWSHAKTPLTLEIIN